MANIFPTNESFKPPKMVHVEQLCQDCLFGLTWVTRVIYHIDVIQSGWQICINVYDNFVEYFISKIQKLVFSRFVNKMSNNFVSNGHGHKN